MSYCASRFRTIRRPSVDVSIGSVGVGRSHPIRVQSMTTTDTQDVAATVRQAIALAEVGCEIVRVTAPNVAAARALRDIRRELTAAGFGTVPLVADIHFLPQAAMEAVEHVEKVRVNPGNYADKKKFVVREYDDAAYDAELQRLHDAFSPLVLRAKALGRCLRIGTNHGSLSDRVMNRYGDTPLGMVESALEFVRICEDHGFHEIVLSMKASNPKVMIEAYRLLAARMDTAHRPYPLHLGVTEAGDGEDGRIKGAIGIGSLLFDGLGDTIRVSLTEDSVYEIPVARALAERAMRQWRDNGAAQTTPDAAETGRDADEVAAEEIDPFAFARRAAWPVRVATGIEAGGENPPRVIVACASVADLTEVARVARRPQLADTPLEAVCVPVRSRDDIAALATLVSSETLPRVLVEPSPEVGIAELASLAPLPSPAGGTGYVLTADRILGEAGAAWAALATRHASPLVIALTPAEVPQVAPLLRGELAAHAIVTLDTSVAPSPVAHPAGAWRALAAALAAEEIRAPLWIRNVAALRLGSAADTSFLGRLLDAAILSGSLLCDGVGDLLSIETEAAPDRAVKLTYNVLQGAGARISKTEYVACPSCGRTLFDLQTTTQRIRAQTGHLKGVKIAIMGCIVNGPGEMADADFGYVGGAPGKINLYVAHNCVQYNIPQAEADARLIALIREHGRWSDPSEVPAETSVASS